MLMLITMSNHIYILLQSQIHPTRTWKKVRVNGLTPSVSMISVLLATVARIENEYHRAIDAMI